MSIASKELSVKRAISLNTNFVFISKYVLIVKRRGRYFHSSIKVIKVQHLYLEKKRGKKKKKHHFTMLNHSPPFLA
jgi:hypothetical protein